MGRPKRDLKRRERTMSAIKAILLDAEEKQASDHRLSTWLVQVKLVLNEANDVVEEFHCRALHKEVMKGYGSTSKNVCDFFSSSNPFAFRFKLAHKIKNIRKRVDDIAADKNQFNLAERLEDRKIKLHRRDITHSFVHPPNVIGRDDDKAKIIDLLMQQDADRNVNVIPIVGIGGLRKTTFVNLVYNNKRVVLHFQLRMWVWVSEDFNITWLIKEIFKFAIGSIDENSSVDQLQICLRELLKDMKFLLVLDDV